MHIAFVWPSVWPCMAVRSTSVSVVPQDIQTQLKNSRTCQGIPGSPWCLQRKLPWVGQIVIVIASNAAYFGAIAGVSIVKRKFSGRGQVSGRVFNIVESELGGFIVMRVSVWVLAIAISSQSELTFPPLGHFETGTPYPSP